METNKVIIFTDGGARGNPGPAAIGVLVGEKQFGKYIGETTNNVAEYSAAIFALEKTMELYKNYSELSILINTDSELMYKQNIGEYRVKDPGLRVLYAELQDLVKRFGKVEFKHVRREYNKLADKIVNQELDRKMM